MHRGRKRRKIGMRSCGTTVEEREGLGLVMSKIVGVGSEGMMGLLRQIV